MSKLALIGGEKVRKKEFTAWPIYDKREEEALIEVLKSREWGTLGPNVKKFEEEFCKYINVNHAVSVSNGTVSLEIILRALNIGMGDEVIVPAYTFLATASAVLMVNATPIFVDIDPDTNCVDPNRIEETITNRTRAIIPVHIAGYAADMDSIMEIAKKHNLPVIEDAAQAHGSEWKGKKLGSIGIAGSFSFQRSKNMSAGEGGIITTNDKQLSEMCWSIHHVGRKKDGAWYGHYYLSSNYRMTDWQAAILRVQLERLEKQIETREDNAKYLDNKLSQISGIELFKKDERVTKNTYHLYMFKYLKDEFRGLEKEKFIMALAAEGIPVSYGYVPLYSQPVFSHENVKKILSREINYAQMNLPSTEKASAQTVWISQNVLLGKHSDMDDIVAAIIKIKENINEIIDL